MLEPSGVGRAIGWIVAGGAWGVHLAIYPSCLVYALVVASSARGTEAALEAARVHATALACRPRPIPSESAG